MSGCSRYLIGFFVIAAALTFTLTAKHGEGSEGGVSGRYAIAVIFWLVGIALLIPWGRSTTSRLAAGSVGLMLVFFNILQVADGEFHPVAFLWGVGGICAILFALTGEIPEFARGILGIDESSPRRKTRKRKRRSPNSEAKRRRPPGRRDRRRHPPAE